MDLLTSETQSVEMKYDSWLKETVLLPIHSSFHVLSVGNLVGY